MELVNGRGRRKKSHARCKQSSDERRPCIVLCAACIGPDPCSPRLPGGSNVPTEKINFSVLLHENQSTRSVFVLFSLDINTKRKDEILKIVPLLKKA